MSATVVGMRPPILVTGAHRSGTTWVGAMLGLAPGALTVPKEPFNPNPRDYALGGLAQDWFVYAPALPQDRAVRAFRRVLDGRAPRLLRRHTPAREAVRYLSPFSHPRLVLHDPIAAFSAEWLAQHFDLEVVVLVRHPAAFAASLRRMDWRMAPRALLDQPALVRDHLAEWAPRLRQLPDEPVAQAGVLWGCIYSVLLRFADRRPEWIVCTHEELARDPVGAFGTLYGRLGLPVTPEVVRGIFDHTRPDNPSASPPPGVRHVLRRDSAATTRAWTTVLEPAESDRLRGQVEPLASRFYGDADWVR